MNEQQQQTHFLGRGWGFPPSFRQEMPGVEMVEKDADVASSLEVLLATALGERVMLPNYGCNLEDLLFESLDTTTKTIVADQVRTALLYHEPRIDVLEITLDDAHETQGIVLIEVQYRIRSTNTRYNLVYPFYIQEGADVNLQVRLNAVP